MDSWSLLVAGGDGRQGGREAHRCLPAKPHLSPAPSPCRSQCHRLQEAFPECRCGCLPPEQPSQGHLQPSTLSCGHYLPDGP